MDRIKDIQELFLDENYNSLSLLTDSLNHFFTKKRNMFSSTLKPVDFDVIDNHYLSDLKNVNSVAPVYFGFTLRDLKCVISDGEGLREHVIYIKYKNSRKYVIHSVNLPFSPYQDKEYNSLDELLNTFRNYINSLSNYFQELEQIDNLCPIVEPLHPTYKDDYRKILLDSRTWLHVEVTIDGTATNIHIIGNSEIWNDKLHSGLLDWDHDKRIVDNIMTIFDISSFCLDLYPSNSAKPDAVECIIEERVCGICLCSELPDIAGIPQPLCQNSVCGVYFHRSCLLEWLLACSGGRPPAFGVVTGTCPTCLYPITCSKTDNRICK